MKTIFLIFALTTCATADGGYLSDGMSKAIGDSTFVNITGDTMTGQLTTVSTLTIQGSAFSVGMSTLVVLNGYVGIGTMTPVGLFQVGGGSLTVLSSGNVGIGKTAPTVTLDVNGAIYASNYISSANSIRAPFWLGESFYFRNSAATIQWMTLKTGGNIGIGNINPGTILHISSGTITMDGTGSPAKGGALCLTTGGVMGKCTTQPDASGDCTCTAP
jgi:hypothetical protein